MVPPTPTAKHRPRIAIKGSICIALGECEDDTE
jgi:hypothetical protein